MTRYSVVLALALSPAWAQLPVPAGTTAAAATLNRIAPQQRADGATINSGLEKLERFCDERLESTGAPDAIQLRGFTRGLRLSDYGAVFTSEVDLVATPTINPFSTQRTMTPVQVKDVHQRKLKNLPLLQQAMRDIIMNSAKALEPELAAEGRIVVAVRLLYQSWEDRSGLPSTIVMKGQRGALQTGKIEEELQ